MPWEVLHISDFGGLNEDENPHAVADNELTFCRNVWKRGRTIGTRPGTQRESDELYAVDISGTPKICGLADFRRDRDSSRNLVAMVPGAIHTEDGTTLDIATNSVVVTNADEELWTFANHKGVLYAAGGDVDAGTPDQAWYWDPSVGAGDVVNQIGIQNLSSSAVQPRWIFAWKNYLFAGGFEDSDLSAGPNIVRYSALNDGQTWPVGNSIGGTSYIGGFSGGGDEYTTGMNSYQDNQDENGFGLILTNKKIYAIKQQASATAPFRITDEIPNGCVAHHAYVNLGLDSGDGIYMSEHGIHSLRQSQAHGAREDKFLSFKIRKTFRTINRAQLSNAVGAYWRELGLVIFAVATGSSTFNNLILALDMRDVVAGNVLDPAAQVTAENARWYIWDLGDDDDHNAAILHTGKASGGKWKIFGGNYKGQVFEFSEDIYSDMGEAYSAVFRTKHFTFDRPFDRKTSGNVLVELQPGGDYQPRLNVVYDFGRKRSHPYYLSMPKTENKWGSTGSFMWGEKWSEGDVNKQMKVYATGFGDSIGYQFQHDGTNERFYVSRLAAQVSHGGEAGTDT